MSQSVPTKYKCDGIIGENEMQNSIMNISNESPCVSLNQNLTTASKIDILLVTTQNPVLQLPRIPGSGKEYIVEVAADFDAPFELGT